MTPVCRYREFREICPSTGDCPDHGKNRPGQCRPQSGSFGPAAEMAAKARDAQAAEVEIEVEVLVEAPKPTPGLPQDSASRKTYPMCAGLLDYFPDALAEVSRGSYVGNEKHNPGEPLHHARGKSMDHADCIIRHLAARGTWDVIELKDGRTFRVRHSVWVAWRALALLQEELETDGAPMARGAA